LTVNRNHPRNSHHVKQISDQDVTRTLRDHPHSAGYGHSPRLSVASAIMLSERSHATLLIFGNGELLPCMGRGRTQTHWLPR
jgi:hypothetical protein